VVFTFSWQNPAFGSAQLRALTGIFVEKSKQVSGFQTHAVCFRLAEYMATSFEISGLTGPLKAVGLLE
jgi:hypothetical protein